MILDSRLQFSSVQALTATAVSTNTIDVGASSRDLGPGEDVYVIVSATTALGGTSPTFKVDVQTDDNSAFSSPRTIGSSETLTSMVAGDRVVMCMPWKGERYIRLNYTLGGTTPTVTVESYLSYGEPPSYRAYPGSIP